MKVVVCGGRDFNDYAKLCAVLDRLFSERGDISVISGMARGADSLAVRYCEERAIPLIPMPANWERDGRSAGFIRNREMVKLADAVVAFWDGVSRGTQHSIMLAKEKGVRVVVMKY